MDVAYTTQDPALLHMLSNGLMMPDHTNFLQLRRAGLMGLDGYGFAGIEEPIVVEDSGGGGLLQSIGDLLGNVVESVGQQLPGVISGTPAPGVYTTTAVPQQPSGLSAALRNPVVLIGLGVGAYFLLKPTRRRNPRRRR